MDPNSIPRELHLDHRAIHRLDHPAGLRLTCREGSVWITLDNDPRDFVLEAGETFRTHDDHPALIYALQAARVSLVPWAAAPRVHRGSSRIESALRAARLRAINP